MNQGMIYDIVHSSFVDGPGIRTTVFFKGCNLRCSWCHNPESQSAQPQMIFYENKCTGCGICREVCPVQTINCTFCGVCEKYCSNGARKICGKICTVEEIMEEIRKDEMFYRNSGGGVTISGGECMLQIGFLKTLLIKCREIGIHTAVDTAGNVPWKSFAEILPYTDLFLYDIKCFTEELHLQGTGASNCLIKENLRRLAKEYQGDIIIRIPIIPGFNTDEEELKKMASFLHTIRCSQIELLPYHKLGENKYPAINKEATLYSVPSKEEMKKIELMF